MPMISTSARKGVKIAILLVLAIVSSVLTYRGLRGEGSPLFQTLAPLLFLVTIIVLIRTGVAALPAQYDRAIFRGRINLLDVAKSGACMLAALSWVAVAVRFVSDTTTGVVILAVPLFLFLGIGVFFLGRSMFRKSQ
jgi:hypothetical protein